VILDDRGALLHNGIAAALADGPTSTDRENLADETIGSVTAKVSRKFGVLPCGDKAAQWHLAFQPFLKARISLNLFREVGRVIYKVLRDGVDLDVVQPIQIWFMLPA